MAFFDLQTPDYSGIEYLRDYHTFGRRDDMVDTSLGYPYISKLHAVIEWCEPNWLIKDVSTNGLKLNNKIIAAQQAVILNVGDVIDMAAMGEVTLVIKDLSAPVPLLINQQSPCETIQIAESILLPNENKPELALNLCPDRKQWFSDSVASGEETGPYENGDLISIANVDWKFLLIAEDDVTTVVSANQTTINDVVFRFDLSQDEESARLTLIHNGIKIDLGERSHHYLLVHLLRHKLQSDTGWLDNQLLMKELGLEETHLNIQIFRARKQVASSLDEVAEHKKLIERRRGALRAGFDNFEIYKEGIKEA